MGKTCIGERLCADKRRRVGECLLVDILGKTIFASKQAAMGGGGAPLFTDGEVAVG